MAFLGESLWIAGLWKGMVDLWKRGWREGLTAQIKTFLFNEQKHNSKKKRKKKKNGTKKESHWYRKNGCQDSNQQINCFWCCVFSTDEVIRFCRWSISLKEVNILFGCWLPHFTSPLSFLPSHASQYQLSVLKELVYGCKLVFNRENWEVFRVPEADLPPPQTHSKHIDLFFKSSLCLRL